MGKKNGVSKERYGIDLESIDKDELSLGEEDVYDVYVADIQDNRDERPSALIVGQMHAIQQRHGKPQGLTYERS